MPDSASRAIPRSAPRTRNARQDAPRAWQRMLSGRRLDLLHPAPLDIEIEDIAHGLSRVARWNGQTTGAWPFSVAEHSLLVEQIYGMARPQASAAERLTALLHDAPEFVIGDLISPFKAVVGDAYKTLEGRLFEATLIRFGLPARPDAALMKRIKRADLCAAYLEAVTLAGFEPEEASKFFGLPRDPEIRALHPEARTPDDAKAAFLNRFEALSG